MTAVPAAWREAGLAVVLAVAAAAASLQVQLVSGQAVQLPVSSSLVASARARVCSDLGWRTKGGGVVRVANLTVALATQLQTLDSH